MERPPIGYSVKRKENEIQTAAIVDAGTFLTIRDLKSSSLRLVDLSA